MKRYIFIGSVEYSAYCLRALLEMRVNIVSIMSPYKKAAKFNSDYCNIEEVASEYGKDVHRFERIANEATYIKEKDPDIIFILGLSQIIPKKILSIPKIGCIGSHPTLLSRNRGRHPIIWAIANGIKKSGVSLFWLNEGIDSGDIWGQKEFDINFSDDAASVYKKVERLSVEILRESIPDLERGVIKRIKQNSSAANYWRRRSKKDGEIDWRMSSKRIYDLVRALTRPYVGAHCIYKNKEYNVWKARIIEETNKFEYFEPGKVLSINDTQMRVKTGDGTIELTEHNIRPLPKIGDYL